MAQPEREHSPYAPASVYESPKFQKYVNVLFAVVLPINVAISYLISAVLIFQPSLSDPSAYFNNGLTSSRIEVLSAYDGTSHHSYVGTLIVSVIAGALIAISACYAYWTKVIRSGSSRRFESRSALGLITAATFIVFFVWFTFFMKIDLEDFRVRGAGIFLWPFFPLFGSTCSFLAALMCFPIFGGVYKILAQMKAG